MDYYGCSYVIYHWTIGYWDNYIYNIYTWIFQVCVFFCSFAKRQKFLLDFSRIAFCLQNRLFENHDPETALTKLLYYTCFALPKLPKYIFIYVLVLPNYPTTFLGLSSTNNDPNRFLCLCKLSQRISWFSKVIAVESCFTQTFSCSYLQLSYTGSLQLQEFALSWTRLSLALDGLRRERGLALIGNNASKTLVA